MCSSRHLVLLIEMTPSNLFLKDIVPVIAAALAPSALAFTFTFTFAAVDVARVASVVRAAEIFLAFPPISF